MCQFRFPVMWMPRWWRYARYLWKGLWKTEGRKPENVGEPSHCSESLSWIAEKEGRQSTVGEYHSIERPLGKHEPKIPSGVLQLTGMGLHWHCSHTQSLARNSLWEAWHRCLQVVDPEGQQLEPLVNYTPCRRTYEWYILIAATIHILAFISTVHWI